jgi:hypothetical protein
MAPDVRSQQTYVVHNTLSNVGIGGINTNVMLLGALARREMVYPD